MFSFTEDPPNILRLTRMLFQQFLDLNHHFLFTTLSPHWRIECKIFIHPNPAVPPLIYRYHILIYLKCPKSIVQPLEPDHRLLQHVQNLAFTHFLHASQPKRTVLSENSKLASMRTANGARFDADVLGLRNGELGVTPPFVDFQIGKKFLLGNLNRRGLQVSLLGY